METSEASQDARELAEAEADIAEKELELFVREHDSTGALKGEKMGRDAARELRERGVERDESGSIRLNPEDHRAHTLLINMGELDRLNTLGGHALGDSGLRLSLQTIEDAVIDVLRNRPEYKDDRRLAEAYDIYRTSGNDFTLTLRGIEDDVAQEIQDRMNRQEVSLASAKPGVEPVPLTASRVARADAIALVNQLEERPEDAGLTDERVIIDAMKEKLQALNDAAKVEARVGRMLEKIRESGRRPEGEGAARNFYETFLKKSLGSVFRTEPAAEPLDYAGFRQLLSERGALEIPPPVEWTHFVAERSLGDAFESLKSRRAVGRKIELELAQRVASEALQRLERFGREIAPEPTPASLGGFEEPKPTRGIAAMAELRNAADAAGAEAGDRPIPTARAKRARLEYDLERAKRDERTGLYGRGVFFETMSRAVQEKRPLATVAIDMAFLKYFDKEGGPGTGNLAIAKAAEILDGVAAAFSREGTAVEAFRTGGDEFALTITGGDAQTIQEVVKAVREAAINAGRIPGTAGVRPTYRPEGLQFNYGIREARTPDAFRNELLEMGVPLGGEEDAAAELPEYLLRLADKEIDIQKGVNRMMFLISRGLEERQTGESRNGDLLTAYSQKAIFGEVGASRTRSFVEQLSGSADPSVEMRKIKTDVLEFVLAQLDARHADAAHVGAELDRRVEEAVKLRFVENRVRELEEEIMGLRMRLTRETEARASLEEALRAAEEEHRAVGRLRERISSPSSGSSPPAAMRDVA